MISITIKQTIGHGDRTVDVVETVEWEAVPRVKDEVDCRNARGEVCRVVWTRDGSVTVWLHKPALDA